MGHGEPTRKNSLKVPEREKRKHPHLPGPGLLSSILSVLGVQLRIAILNPSRSNILLLLCQGGF